MFGLIGDNVFINAIGVIVALIVVLRSYYSWRFSYWKKRNIPSYGEPAIPYGNLENPLNRKTLLGLLFKKYYDEMKAKGHKAFGMYFFTRPIYMPIDLDQIKNIMTKDFNYFVDRGVYYNEKHDPLSAHLFAIGGTKWKNLRAKLSPTFTSGKMKMMFPTLVECSKILEKVMKKLHEQQEPIDIKEVLGCFTTDIIGSCAFGLECNTFEEKDSLFRKYGKKVFEFSRIMQLKFAFAMNFPNIAKDVFKLRIVSQEVSDFFFGVVRKAIDYREKNNYVRKDFLQILMDLNKQVEEQEGQHDGKSLTFEEMVAQSFVFFIAGFETSSTTMTFALFELATHQDIQDKVRKEVIEVLARHNGEMTYEAINEMKYMGQVIDETLRKYPAVSFLTRDCGQDYSMPNTDTVIEKGTRIVIPVMAIHYDKEYYPNPDKFDPERFTEDNKQSRPQYTHLPFGEGPRICIGMRFGLMQSKVGLATLLKNYKINLNKKTQTPIVLSPQKFIPTAVGDIWLSTETI